MKRLLTLTILTFLASPALAACTDEEVDKVIYLREQKARSISHGELIESATIEKAQIDSNIDDVEKGRKTLEEVKNPERVDA